METYRQTDTGRPAPESPTEIYVAGLNLPRVRRSSPAAGRFR